MQTSKLTEALTKALNHHSTLPPAPGGDRIIISRTVSAMAIFYEKVRVAMEYKEEHLLRRAAIERILVRRLMLNENGKGVAEQLLKELLWAQYAPANSMPVSMIAQVQIIIDKYNFIRTELQKGRRGAAKNQIFEWFVSTCAAEIEERIAPDPKREAFINFIYQYYRGRVFLQDETQQTTDIQVYIAVHRAFAKSDNDFIRYELLKLYYPNMTKKTWMDVRDHTTQLYAAMKDFDYHLSHKIGLKLTRSLKKEIAPFLILQDLYDNNPSEFVEILEDEKKLLHSVDLICRQTYDDIGKKIRRAGARSVIYVFLTKMIFAVLLEYPIERYLLGEFKVVPLAINTLFPPFLMVLALLGNRPPGQGNTKRIIARIKEIIYLENKNEQQITLTMKTPSRRPLLQGAFVVLYSLTYFLVFGSIIFTLYKFLDFSPIGIVLFIFFVTVIMFFAYRVRQVGKEYVLQDKEGLFAPVSNFFLLPILSVGKWLSGEISRFNVLIAVFDFIIEAPFKAIFEIFEEWFSFMRRQKEEII